MEIEVKEIDVEDRGSVYGTSAMNSSMFIGCFDIKQRFCDEKSALVEDADLSWASTWRKTDGIHDIVVQNIMPQAGAFISSVTPKENQRFQLRYDNGILKTSIDDVEYHIRGLNPEESNELWEQHYAGKF